MKKQIVIALLLAATARAENAVYFKAGETNSIAPGLKIYVESISTTNLYNVIFYEYDPLDKLKRTGHSEYANYDMSKPDILILNLHDVTFKQTSKDGIEQTIKAKLCPIRVDTKTIRIHK